AAGGAGGARLAEAGRAGHPDPAAVPAGDRGAGRLGRGSVPGDRGGVRRAERGVAGRGPDAVGTGGGRGGGGCAAPPEYGGGGGGGAPGGPLHRALPRRGIEALRAGDGAPGATAEPGEGRG